MVLRSFSILYNLLKTIFFKIILLKDIFTFTIRKLTKPNGSTDKKILLVYCGEIYRPNFPSLNPSVNTDRNVPTVYTKGITVGKEGIKKVKQFDDV